MDGQDDRIPLRTARHDHCDLLSSMEQLILYLCGGQEQHSSRINNALHIDIEPLQSTSTNHHNDNLSISTCSLYHAERWIQQLTASHINSEMITNPSSSSAISCTGYYLYDLRSKLHSTWLTTTNNIPHFLQNTKIATEKT